MMKKIIAFVIMSIIVLAVLLSGCSTPAAAEIDKNTSTTTTVINTTTGPEEDQDTSVAEDFIKDNSTFQFDGIDGSLVFVSSDPGWTNSFRSWSYTFAFETGHPGYGDRTGQILPEVITKHTAIILINTETHAVVSAVWDNVWDMIKDVRLPTYVSGLIVSGGDTTGPDGPLDAPRTFTYKLLKDDGSSVYVSYTSYPPSPAGDVKNEGINLDFYNGTVTIGDYMNACGILDANTNTITMQNPGNYITTSLHKVTITGVVVSGEDTTPADGPVDTPRVFVYELIRDDGTFINVSYTAYPPSPVGNNAGITISLYDGSSQPGDWMRVTGTYDKASNTMIVKDGEDFIKTYEYKP